MLKDKITRSVVEKIKAQGLKHRAAWEFVLKNVGFWSLFFLTMLVGAIAVSLILFIFAARKNPMMGQIDMGFLPIFWLIILGLFFSLAIWAYHQTRGGYKISWQKLVLIFILIILGVGILNHGFRGAEKFDRFLEDKVPVYKGVEMRHGRVWTVPIEGKIGGKILKVNSGKLVEIRTFNGEEWGVTLQQEIKIQRGEVWCFKGEAKPERNFIANEGVVCFKR